MLQVEARPPTRFQRHVLHVLRRYGPCGLAAIAQGCRAPPRAVRLAAWLLRRAGFIRRCGRCRYTLTMAGRAYVSRTAWEHRR